MYVNSSNNAMQADDDDDVRRTEETIRKEEGKRSPLALWAAIDVNRTRIPPLQL